jgi:nitroreductase
MSSILGKAWRWQRALLMPYRERLSLWMSRAPLLRLMPWLATVPTHFAEAYAVLRGNQKNRRDRFEGHGNVYVLRRNVHRLEKGIIMRGRRSTFAADYIEHTVQLFLRAWTSEDFDRESVLWARDVLLKYFEIVGRDNPAIERARSAMAAAAPPVDGGVHRVPATRASFPRSGVTLESFRLLCRQRRSVRWFDSRPVPRDLIDAALECAGLAPSACNRQPYRLTILENREQIDRVGRIPGGVKGYVENIPVLAVVVGDLSAYQRPKDRHAIYIDASLAMMSLMLALETVGLSSCSINWPDLWRAERRLRQHVRMEAYERPVMLLAIGYAAGEDLVPYSQKKSLAVMRDYVDARGDAKLGAT